ncbi:MAG: arrestin family protein [Candidatus Micrarchaeota archaeon]
MFGIGAGKAEIKLPKTVYAPGEAIEGQLLLTLSGPTKAKGVFVKLYAEQTFRERTSSGRVQQTARRVYEFPLQLDGEKEYAASQPLSYEFKLKIPDDVAKTSAPAQTGVAGVGLPNIGISIGGLRLDSGLGPVGPARWFVEGQLDIPLGIDVKNRVQINL